MSDNITQYTISYKNDTFRELLPNNIDLGEFTSNSIHTYTDLLANNSKRFFERLNVHLNRQNSAMENSQLELPKRILVRPIQKVPKKIQIFSARSYKIRKKILAPQNGGRGGYTPWKIKIQRQTTRKLLG